MQQGGTLAFDGTDIIFRHDDSGILKYTVRRCGRRYEGCVKGRCELYRGAFDIIFRHNDSGISSTR